MTAQHRAPGRNPNRRHVPRHAAWRRPRTVDEHVAVALPADDLMALADVTTEAIDVALWDLEFEPADGAA